MHKLQHQVDDSSGVVKVSIMRFTGCTLAGTHAPALALALGAVIAASSMTTTSCVNFDLAEDLADTRVLAVVTEPAEILFSPLYLTPPQQRPPFPLPITEVDVEVFAFDPRGGRTNTSIQMCPEDGGDSACRLYDKDADLDFVGLLEPARSEVEALLRPATFDEDIDDEASALGRIGPSKFHYTITPGAIDFFQTKDDEGNNIPSIFPLLPRFAVAVENETQRDAGAAVFKERAFKRLPLILDLSDPSLPVDFRANLARGAGIALCDSPLPAPVDEDGDGVDDVFIEGNAACLHPRVQNQNPAFKGFRLESTNVPDELSEGMLEGVPDLGLGSLVRAVPGGQLVITPMWDAHAIEHYQVISFDVADSKLIILNRIEDIACNWYATGGKVSSGLTSLQFNNERLGILWDLPTDVEVGERDSLLLVVLDQRGGTAVGEITVEYKSPS